MRRRVPTRPRLPDERPFIDAEAWRDIRAASGPAVVEDVAKAFGAAGEALEQGDETRAKELLEWAKAVAPRSAMVREALGVLRYALGDLKGAQSELQTYRRLTGRADQNHLLADCARAAGRREKVNELVDQMFAQRVKAERLAEGLLVLAGDRADHDDLQGALDVLERADLQPARVQLWHLRLWYMAADLSQRLGRTEEARDYFEAIVLLDEDFGDAADRLAALED